ncbi:MAG: creatininase family protein [Phycisphaeraceae bacterium]|nr:creatininase family protein [Phycisphaeraceae bacterium]
MTYQARPYVLHEASYRQMLDHKPNVAVLPWGATEAHNYHLPHGTDVIEAVGLSEQAAAAAVARGAKCVVLPVIPFGIDHAQLNQVATITMRARTQALVLRDVAESLVRQGIDRLVLVNFHGGNEFKSMVRDVMLDLPILIVVANGFQMADNRKDVLDEQKGDHADEFETSIVMHLTPDWVAPLSTAGDGSTRPSELPALTSTPGVWCTRHWPALTADTGVGNPRRATADKGRRLLARMVELLTEVLVQLSAAKRGQFPFVLAVDDPAPGSSAMQSK